MRSLFLLLMVCALGAHEALADTEMAPEKNSNAPVIYRDSNGKTTLIAAPQTSPRRLSSLVILNTSDCSSCLLPESPPSWSFPPETSINLTGNAHVILTPNKEDHITVTSLNDAKAQIMSDHNSTSLSLTTNTYTQKGRIVVSLPQTVKALTIHHMGLVESDAMPSISALTVIDTEKVHLKSAHFGLEKLYVDHTKNVDLEGVATPYLLAKIRASGSVTLKGTFAIRALEALDTQSVTLSWVDSPFFTVHATGSSHVFLGGVAEYSHLVLQDQAHVDAKYLRVKRLFVETQDQTQAEVAATDALNALAKGDSNIYYYRQPAVLSRYYHDHGSILYMGDALPACHLPYCLVLPNVVPG